MTPHEQARAVVSKHYAEWHYCENGPQHPSFAALVKDIAQLISDTEARVWGEAAKRVFTYNCDHNHGKKATKACDELEEEFRQHAQRVTEG